MPAMAADEMSLLLFNTWQRLRDRFRNNPAEVARRLRRGRDAWLKRPPRAWCLAIRASDTRITPMTAICEPEDAAYPRDAIAPHLRTTEVPHRVTIDRELLVMLTKRVRVGDWGEPQEMLAGRLGRNRLGLRIARAKGKLKTYHDPPPGGRSGPRPICSAPDGPLDPNARLFERADRAWGWTGILAYWRLRDEVPPQAIERVPVFVDRTRAYADRTGLHLEHPLLDPPPPRDRSANKLGKPVVTDNAPYKWKGDIYIGYDWRAAQTNPLIREHYEYFQRRRALARAAARKRRANGGGSGGGGGAGSLLFRGWRWLCPVCGRRSSVLFFPLPPVNVIRGYGCFIEDDLIDAAFALDPELRHHPQRPHAGLACQTCHRIRTTNCSEPAAWNNIIRHLSGGLLYGHEVPRPAWFTTERQKPYRPLLGRAPSKRIPQVQTMLLRGLSTASATRRSYAEIANKLGVLKTTVSLHARRVFKLLLRKLEREAPAEAPSSVA